MLTFCWPPFRKYTAGAEPAAVKLTAPGLRTTSFAPNPAGAAEGNTVAPSLLLTSSADSPFTRKSGAITVSVVETAVPGAAAVIVTLC